MARSLCRIMPVDVQALDVDFLAFSGHKMLGPTGIGVLYGKRDLLEAMPPWMGGGDMISTVTLEGSTWNDLPYKFEAGTPSIAEAIGLGSAVDYLNALGMETIHAHEQEITAYALERLAEVPGVTVYGPEAEKKGGVATFTMQGIHAHDRGADARCGGGRSARRTSLRDAAARASAAFRRRRGRASTCTTRRAKSIR